MQKTVFELSFQYTLIRLAGPKQHRLQICLPNVFKLSRYLLSEICRPPPHSFNYTTPYNYDPESTKCTFFDFENFENFRLFWAILTPTMAKSQILDRKGPKKALVF